MTGTIGGLLRTGQSPVAGCYEQDKKDWRGVANRTGIIGGVLRTGQSPVAEWRGVANRT